MPAPFFRSRLSKVLCGVALCSVLSVAGAQVVQGQSRSAALTGPDRTGARPAFLLFSLQASSVEREFVAGLPKDGIRVVSLRDLDAPEAREFHVHETPTLIRLTSVGKEQERCVGGPSISTHLVGKTEKQEVALTCSVRSAKRLQWVEETDRRAPWVYRKFQAEGGVPEIFKTMSLRPELMDRMHELSERAHFSDGFLDCRTKERIATLVSALNRSRYCTSSHAAGLVDLGGTPSETSMLAAGEIDIPGLNARQHAILAFARRLTKEPGANFQEDVARLRAAGWRDEQIFEAAFDVSLFNFFNRMASAYHLETPSDGWKPMMVAAARPTR